MIIKCDAAQLEWRAKVFLAQDPVAMAEILDPSRDIHSENQSAFGLPERVVAKNFLFRMIFADAFGKQGLAGPAYAFTNDVKFNHVSTSAKYWEKVVERFFDKYKGVYNHSINLIREATTTGRVVSPSGREYVYSPVKKYNGDIDWPRTQILNHIVQGFSADLMILVRAIIRREWPYYGPPENSLLINTVHDDVEADVANDEEIVYHTCIGMSQAFPKVKAEAAKWYGIDLNVPFAGESKFGMNLSESQMSKFNEQTFKEDFYRCLKN